MSKISDTKNTIGKSRTNFKPRKFQRRILVNQESFRELSRYSPRGSGGVAGNARQDKKTPKRNKFRGPLVRSARGSQKKSSIDSSGVGADICPPSPQLGRADFRCATTNPNPPEAL